MKFLNRLALCSIAAVSILSSTSVALQRNTQADDEVLSRTIRQKYAEKKEDGLNVVVYLIAGGQETPVDPRVHSFKKGDEVRIDFRSNFDGCIYFVNIDPAGEKAVVYPDLRFNEGDNLIRADRPYRFPNNNTFEFQEDQKGVEILQVIMARRPIAFLEDAITNHRGVLGKTKSNAASELGGFVTGSITQVLPDKGDQAVMSRTIRLAPPKDKDKEGAVVNVEDKQLKPGEAAVFEIHLRRN